MSNNEAKQATPHAQLIAEILDSRIAKNEHGWAARREIERLHELLGELRDFVAKHCTTIAAGKLVAKANAMLANAAIERERQ